MKLHKNSLGAFLVGYAASLALVPSDAEATSRRVSGTVCHPDSDTTPEWEFRTTESNASFNSSASGTLYCPVPSDTGLGHQQINRLNVHGFNSAGSSMNSKACVIDWATPSVDCGAFRAWGSDFAGAQDVDASRWRAREWWYPYIHTDAPPNGTIYGFYVTD